MKNERKYRSTDEVTGDILVKRLDHNQLVQLVGNEEFKKFQPRILEKLQSVNGIRFRDFKKIHSSKACELEEIETGNDVKVSGKDIDIGYWSEIVKVQKTVCNSHHVASNTYFNYFGQGRDGPFLGDE